MSDTFSVAVFLQNSISKEKKSACHRGELRWGWEQYGHISVVNFSLVKGLVLEHFILKLNDLINIFKENVMMFIKINEMKKQIQWLYMSLTHSTQTTFTYYSFWGWEQDWDILGNVIALSSEIATGWDHVVN